MLIRIDVIYPIPAHLIHPKTYNHLNYILQIPRKYILLYAAVRE
jgi:hypothetical protein